MLPQHLDARLEQLDEDGALRSTTLQTSDSWSRQRRENILGPLKKTQLDAEAIGHETKKAFDLLDAISRSGSQSVEGELHVIVALSHCFERDLMATLVEENINPIDKVERSALLLTSMVHQVAPSHVVNADQDKRRLELSSPELFNSSM